LRSSLSDHIQSHKWRALCLPYRVS
jgi:hypothetical protein